MSRKICKNPQLSRIFLTFCVKLRKKTLLFLEIRAGMMYFIEKYNQNKKREYIWQQ